MTQWRLFRPTHHQISFQFTCCAVRDTPKPTPQPTPQPTPKPTPSPTTPTTTTITRQRQEDRKSWIRLDAGKKCELPFQRPIDNLADCEAAFDALKVSKEYEQIERVTSQYRPKGCSSSCYDNHWGHSCRRFNDHRTGNGKSAYGKVFFLCKNNSAHSTDNFVRVLSEGTKTCKSEDLSDIETIEECENAFEEEKHHEKTAEKIRVGSFAREPKGCYSDCFDVWDGYTCRKFNEHATGNDARSARSRNVLCENLMRR
jgi:hypothetical protein